MSEGTIEVCIIGAGPRGLSVLERLCANGYEQLAGTELVVHVVDDRPPGAGAVWRTDQPPQLLMNTVSSQVTIFTDTTVEMAGVLRPGPSLYEWASFLRLMGPLGLLDHGWEYPEEVYTEACALTPDSYPTRGFYGHYLHWAFRRVVRDAPANIRVEVHPCRAARLRDEGDGRQVVTLDDGTSIPGLHAVVLAQGHLPVEPGADERALAAFAVARGLTYLRPENPADTDLSALTPGQPVALRGLGLNFFDHLALLTLGRGGAFVRADDGTLRYRPSGLEPRLYASSRRGLPYQSRGRNQKGAHGRHEPLILNPATIETLRKTDGGLDFRRDLWPIVAKEAETVYYSALLARRECTCEVDRFRTRYLDAPGGSAEETGVLDAFGIGADDRWDWDRIARPYAGRTFDSPADYRGWLLGLLRDDLVAAEEGNIDGPVKAALDVLRDLRNEVRLVVDHGGLTGRSHRDDLERWYTPLNAFLSIGPPALRVEQMIALMEAGVLDVLGPDMRVTPDEEQGVFTVESRAVPGSMVRVTALIEARLPDIDLRRTTDPLLRDLLDTGQCRPYTIPDPELGDYQTGGLAVTERPYQVIRGDGTPHPRRFAYGVPTESVHWVTAAGVRPGVNSVTLGDSDAIALAVLGLAAAVAGSDTARVRPLPIR
ncbi:MULTISPECIES: FAD/NAD(P)-binding protein [unclassified Streptomyces]|uniref:FAD/NAD(P)-binding protein n=1 Tax=unclassified Streptomyces TaxID=2593676 RepID=UPI002E286D6C|nr:FAD/NAD(P)-binding protein [Streptomyces sp. NBC_00223]